MWQLRPLGAVNAQRGTLHLNRWPSRAVVALLARLALAPDRARQAQACSAAQAALPGDTGGPVKL